MFTGLIEAVGKVNDIRFSGQENELVVQHPLLFEKIKLGDSIAINGVCLTVSRFAGGELVFDVMPETLRRSNLHKLLRGSFVNMERALVLGERLGGHLVTGHIDGVGRVTGRRSEGNAILFTIQTPEEVREYLIKKGSVAIDGISLTIGDITNEGFWISIIPHTLTATALQYRQVGDAVNLEADIIGKYVVRYLERRQPSSKGISFDFLKQHGF
ncbi:MAG: riboflavin synthase [Bacillota bacterium]|nr:MAG: riboflavin synthase [Bacillota bacterium]MBS3949203.1 riboflavin synthase [Peptococcaceae bacterium]